MHRVSYYALMSLTVHELFTPSDVYFVSISTRLQAKAIAHAVPDSLGLPIPPVLVMPFQKKRRQPYKKHHKNE